ncbi:MAG TPA: carotenoid biosynthesis protein [Methylomirabilota bacterium]|nr:carotenoid biosynthesis protein [Methylomirabilota bacterium]
MPTLALIATLLVGTVTLRPYVIGFLVFFLVAATRDLGTRRAVGCLAWGAGVALVAELSSTHVGIPFGLYHYTGETRGAELFLANVPIFSPLSFPFLAYAGFCVARLARPRTWAASRCGRVGMVLLAGILMTLLDVVIDPLAVRGDRWFLGHVFYYPAGGVYFGVPLSNFVGWLLVGWVTLGGLVAAGESGAGSPRLGAVLYALVLFVNLGVTFWIEEWVLGGVGIVVHLMVFLLLYTVSRAAVGRWSAEPLGASATSGGGRAS